MLKSSNNFMVNVSGGATMALDGLAKGNSLMAQEIATGSINGTGKAKGRGQTKPFPPISFEKALVIPSTIYKQSVDGNIRRLTLLEILDRSPGSSGTRQLISSSYRYGLTIGSYRSDTIRLTESGAALFEEGVSFRDLKERQFVLAIAKVESFDLLYGRLKGNKFPNNTIMKDMFGEVGVKIGDRSRAVKIFEENLRYLGLVKQMAGGEFVLGLDDVDQDITEKEMEVALPRPAESPIDPVTDAENKGSTAVATNRPALHIDIQVHIDASSSAEQIEQIFASMARHLYGSDS